MPKKSIIPVIFTLLLILLQASTSGAWWADKIHSDNAEAQNLIDEADKELAQSWTREKLDKAVGYLERAAKLDPDNDGILVKLSGLYFELGHHECDDDVENPEAGKSYFRRGYESAKKALSLKESSAAHYFAAINLGSLTESESTFSQARSFIEIRSHINWIGENDESYGHGAYARFWCDCHQHAPSSIIGLIGKDKEEVCEAITKAIEEEPNYVENYVYQAKCCMPDGDTEAYLSVLESALSVDLEAMPEEKGSNEYFHKKALEMWTEATGKDYPER